MTISAMKSRKNNDASGLTFLELLLLIVIIGALAGVSAANFRRTFRQIELNTTVSNLQSFLNSLSQRAIVERKPVILTFAADKNSALARLKGSTTKLKSYPLPQEIKVELDKADAEVVFYPDSSIDSVTITLTNRNGDSRRLTTKGVLGSVKIQP
jgi:Tfp pilus assembly protein FimT